MSDDKTEILLSVETEERISDEELVNLTYQLRDDILDTNVKSADFIKSGTAPEDSRAIEPVTLGALLVTLASSGGVLTTLIGTIKDWLTRNEKSSITLEINGDKISITGASPQQEEQLVREWIKRHKKS